MKKNIIFITLLLIVFACKTQNKVDVDIPSHEQLEAKKQKLTKEQLNSLQENIDFLSDKSLREIKALLKQIIKKSDANKKNYINHIEKDVLSLKHSYTTEEEEYDPWAIIDLNFVEIDSLYIDYLKKGLIFGQQFKEDTNYVYIMLDADIDGMSSFKMSNSQSLHPYPSMSSKSLPDIYLKKIYYSNGEMEEDVYPEWCYFLDSDCIIGRKIPIDSLLVHYSISTICESDSVIFYPEDLNTTKEGFTVVAFDENYFSYICNSDITIDEKAYNKENKPIDIDQQLEARSVFATDTSYNQWITEITKLSEKVNYIDIKEDAIQFLAYHYADSYLNDSASFRKHHLMYKGNIKKVVLYVEKKRCVSQFNVMFRSGMCNQELFTNSFKDKTFLINKKGERVMSFPIGNLEFIGSKDGFSDRGMENTNYLKSCSDCYHIDYESSKLTKMEGLTNLKSLSADLVSAWDNEKRGVAIINNQAQKITDTIFGRVEINGNLLVAQINRFQYILMNSKGKRILSGPVVNISPHYNDLYKVTIYDDHLWGNKDGFINSKGQWILKPNYEHINSDYDRRDPDFRGELQIIKKDNLYGLFNVENGGKLSVTCKYDDIYIIPKSNGTKYIAELNGKYGVITIDNKILYPFKFSLKEILDKYNIVQY